MIRKSTIAALAIMATVGAASPAFALAANSPALAGGGSLGYNSTNVLTGTAASIYGLNSPETGAITGGSSGLHTFAMVSRATRPCRPRCFRHGAGSAVQQLRRPGR
jgi:hypothetical protein